MDVRLDVDVLKSNKAACGDLSTGLNGEGINPRRSQHTIFNYHAMLTGQALEKVFRDIPHSLSSFSEEERAYILRLINKHFDVKIAKQVFSSRNT